MPPAKKKAQAARLREQRKVTISESQSVTQTQDTSCVPNMSYADVVKGNVYDAGEPSCQMNQDPLNVALQVEYPEVGTMDVDSWSIVCASHSQADIRYGLS